MNRKQRLAKSRNQIRRIERLSKTCTSQAEIARVVKRSRERVRVVLKKIREGKPVGSVGRPLGNSENGGNALFQHIGKVCRDARIKMDLNQGDIVVRTRHKVNASDLSMFERGKACLNSRKLKAVLDPLGLTLGRVWPKGCVKPEQLAKQFSITPWQAVDLLIFVDKLQK